MKTYYHKHPRGFANECTIVRCDDPAHTSLLEDAGFERITSKELRSHVSSLNQSVDSWGSKAAFGKVRFAAITNPDHPEYDDFGSKSWVDSRQTCGYRF